MVCWSEKIQQFPNTNIVAIALCFLSELDDQFPTCKDNTSFKLIIGHKRIQLELSLKSPASWASFTVSERASQDNTEEK